MKKSTGLLIFGVTAATVAAGAYYVYKHQDKFFKTEEVITPEGPVQKRNYMSLDVEGAKSQINESITKTKEAAQETFKKVGTKLEETFNKDKNANTEEMEYYEVEETVEITETDESADTENAEAESTGEANKSESAAPSEEIPEDAALA